MRKAKNSVSVYLVCFHSESDGSLENAGGQFLRVEESIRAGEWPYDNGDDPSFYVARMGGPLTWGVCRQDLRNSICRGSVVVFFSFSSLGRSRFLYRLCAVSTVIDKVDVRAVYSDRRFSEFRDSYINCLIRPERNGWRHDESNRDKSQSHDDWLWRIADHRGCSKKKFETTHRGVYKSDVISKEAMTSGELTLADNYVVLASAWPLAYMPRNPPEVAIARVGGHEKWNNKILRQLTVGQAARCLPNGRDYLRCINSSNRNVHRQIRFTMSEEEVILWRRELICALKAPPGRRAR